MSDPLERRMVDCHIMGDDRIGCSSTECKQRKKYGGCIEPEPAEVWAERCARVARWLAQYLSDWLDATFANTELREKLAEMGCRVVNCPGRITFLREQAEKELDRTYIDRAQSIGVIDNLPKWDGKE